MAGINENTKLMLHCNGADGSTTFTDVSPSNHGNANVVGTAQVDTAIKKFGTGSLLVDGDSDYLYYCDSNDWDIIGSNSDNWTIDFWIYPHSTSGTHFLIGQYEDANNSWNIRLGDAELDWYFERSGGDLTTGWSGPVFSANQWQHVAFIKVGNKYACYYNGLQKSYATWDTIDTLNGNLNIGIRGSTYFDGQFDEIRIQHSNYFNASPNVGKTDSFTIPTEEYSYDAVTRGQAIIIN